MKYFRSHYKLVLIGVLPCIAYNLYFIFLLPEIKISYLIYLDFLIAIGMAAFYAADIVRYGRLQRKKQELLAQDYLIWQEFQRLPELHGHFQAPESSESPESMDTVETDIAGHDVLILQKQLQKQFDANCALQDYIAKWCHEVKIPLSACLLMAEKIEDVAIKDSLLEQLERINLQLRSALLGTKMQSSLFDLQVRETSILECVKESIHNNQFFLIRKHFTLDIQTGEGGNMENTDTTGAVGREEDTGCTRADGIESICVYTDPLWLTYVLDQLISNAVKYAREAPILRIYSRKQGEAVQLCIEDNGEGIKECDIRRIFEKGYIGSSYHNGQYKSTGMGLYMVSEILKKLEHGITVESEYGKGTKFTITFRDNREYFNL